MHQDQNELDLKLDRLQKEIEKLKQENILISTEKNEAVAKCRIL